jgi:hypothetical protein
MQTKFWVRRVLLAVVWGLAVSTWASIAHHLAGMPDVGPILVLATMSFILVRPAKRGSLPEGRSSVSDSAVHMGAPTA